MAQGLSFSFDASKGETPASIAQKRALIAQLMGSQKAPSTIGEGFSALGDGIVANVLGRRADDAQSGGQSQVDAFRQMLLGGGSAPQAANAGGAAPGPSGADAASIRQGLIDRGLPEQVADGFLMNFQDESGLNPGINEAAPTVPGSRGGFGLAQWTGPRRVALEQFAAQRGADPSDTNAQLDFLMNELQGPEANAAKSILAAPDAGSAAAAIATNFLRPAPENLAPRVARYTGGGQQQPTQVASLDPGIGATAAASPPAGIAPQASPPSQQVADGGLSMQQLMQAAGNPFVMAQYGDVINSMISQHMQTQQQANDPLRQLQIQAAQKSLGAQPKQWQKLDDHTLFDPVTGETKPVEGGGGPPQFEGTGMEAQAWNILQSAAPDSKEYATAYSIIAQPKPQMVQTENGMMLVPVAPQLPAWLVPPGGASQPNAAAPAPTQPDTLLPNVQQMPAPMDAAPQAAPLSQPMPPAASPVSTPSPATPQAGVGQLIPGTRKPSTEAQDRNGMLSTVLTSDLPTINANFDALGDPTGQLLGGLPMGLGNAWQSEEYQRAANAVSSSVSNILYSVSGASANPGELAKQVTNLTPQFGDKPGTIADKKRRLNTFVNAVANASGNPELIAKARAESISGMGGGPGAPDPVAPAETGGVVDFSDYFKQ